MPSLNFHVHSVGANELLHTWRYHASMFNLIHRLVWQSGSYKVYTIYLSHVSLHISYMINTNLVGFTNIIVGCEQVAVKSEQSDVLWPQVALCSLFHLHYALCSTFNGIGAYLNMCMYEWGALLGLGTTSMHDLEINIPNIQDSSPLLKWYMYNM